MLEETIRDLRKDSEETGKVDCNCVEVGDQYAPDLREIGSASARTGARGEDHVTTALAEAPRMEMRPNRPRTVLPPSLVVAVDVDEPLPSGIMRAARMQHL